jgi:2,3-bisphosphoglycerate-dependent phosphoglycerate mutase
LPLTPSLILVRHCATSGQHPEAPLTEAGQAQAVALASRLAALPIDHVVSSPYVRATGTIEPFARSASLEIHVDERLAERRLSPEPIEHWRDVVKLSFEDPDFTVPGGESGRATLERGLAAIHDVLGAGHRLPVVVSHGQLLALVLHSLDPGFGFAGWEAMRNPDVYVLGRRAGRLAFERLPDLTDDAD